MKMLSTAPALILGAVQALLALLVGLGLHLSAGQSGAILTVTAAAVALIAGLIAHKFSIGLVTAVVTAVVTLLVSFGVHGVSSGIVATLNAAIVAIAMLLAHIHLTQLGAIEAARGQRTFP